MAEKNKLTLIVMAAGMGSRYGGLKQIDPVNEQGEIIMDFSVYDALRAGFDRMVFVIKKEFAEDFKKITAKWEKKGAEIKYAYQELADLPRGFVVPANRVKPWGTGHAVLAAREFVDGDFVVINADDFYGFDSFKIVAEYLTNVRGAKAEPAGSARARSGDFCMSAYNVESTLTENGTVSRGVCEVDGNGLLISVTERTRIHRRQSGEIVYEDGCDEKNISVGTPVSMNFWGFRQGFMDDLAIEFQKFLEGKAASDPLNSEFYLPSCVSSLLSSGNATVKVLRSSEQWFGITYKEDKEAVVAALCEKKRRGAYPKKLSI